MIFCFQGRVDNFTENFTIPLESRFWWKQEVSKFDSKDLIFLGVLPLTVAQNVERSYGLDPSRAAIEASIRTQSKYRKRNKRDKNNYLLFFLLVSAHTEHVSLRNCSNRDQVKTIFEQIQNEKNDKSSVTFVFGPARNELERADLRQSKKSSWIEYFWDFLSF